MLGECSGDYKIKENGGHWGVRMVTSGRWNSPPLCRIGRAPVAYQVNNGSCGVKQKSRGVSIIDSIDTKKASHVVEVSSCTRRTIPFHLERLHNPLDNSNLFWGGGKKHVWTILRLPHRYVLDASTAWGSSPFPSDCAEAKCMLLAFCTVLYHT